MANTIVGVNPLRIAQLTLDVLSTMPFDFSYFTTDLSDSVAESGDTVVTRYADNPAVIDFSVNKTSGNRVLTAVTTTLYHYAGVPVGFTDKEMSYSDIALAELYIKPSLTSLFVNVQGNVMGLIGATLFTGNTICNATNFSAANVANIATNLTKANVPLDGRHLIINPDMALTLKKDAAILPSYAYGSPEVIRTGVIPPVLGFNVTEFNGTIPTNSSNMIGFACRPQALVLATRVAATPVDWYGKCINIKDPRSGLTIQFRSYYDGSLQKTEYSIIYGAQVGNPGQLWRICSS